MKTTNKIKLIPLVLALLAGVVSCGPISNPTSNPTSDATTNPSSNPTTEETTAPSVSNPTTVDPTSNPSTSNEDPTTKPSVSDPTTAPVTNPTDLEKFNEKYTMYDFFGTENKVKIEIDMDKKELYQLSEDYDAYPHHSSPIYRVCNVTFTINEDSVTLNKVGIRLKGNTSRRKFVNEDGYIYSTVHFKLDFNEIIDYVDYEEGEEEVIDERTFLGLKKLDIKWNKNYDTSHVKEYVASELYREYDVKSQHMGFANVEVNDTNLGLYYTYETIDKQFAKRYYSKAAYGGDLYKVCYTAKGPADFTRVKVGDNVGEEDEEANDGNGFFPSYDIKTNKDETDHSSLINMVEVLNKSNTKIEDIAKVVDLNQFLTYEAVSYVLGDPDDLRNNWNNSYLYFNNDTKLAEILPYDKDRMFGTQCDWNPTGNGMTTVNPLSNWAQGAGKEQTNPLYRKVLSRPLDGTSEYISYYMNLIVEIFDNSKILAGFNDTYEAVRTMYSDIVIPDNDLPYAEFSLTRDDINLTFDTYIKAKESHFTNKYNEYFNK